MRVLACPHVCSDATELSGHRRRLGETVLRAISRSPNGNGSCAVDFNHESHELHQYLQRQDDESNSLIRVISVIRGSVCNGKPFNHESLELHQYLQR